MKRCIAAISILILSASAYGASPAAFGGRVLEVDGHPASGFQVILLSTAGEELLRAGTDGKGTFLFEELDPGSYELGIRSPEGDFAPVLAEPTELEPGQRVVREIRLVEMESPLQLAPAKGGLGVWWAGLTKPAKIWTVLGTMTAIGLIYSATDDDDDNEPTVTPFRID